jgi:predicted O-linked N-acetylglucosamine transferase (SPINDLY family)
MNTSTETVREHLKARRFAEAEALLQQILQSEPDHAESLHLLGMLYYQAKNLQPAVDLVGRAVAADGNVPAYQCNLGVILKDMGRVDEAIKIYRGVLTRWPAEAGAHVNLGVALRAQGNLQGAIAAYRAGLAVGDEVPEAHNNLANALMDAGKVDEAIESYQRAVNLKPNFADGHLNLGWALLTRHRGREAEIAFRRALELRPNHAEASNGLGSALLEQSRIEEGIAAMRQSVQWKPDYADGFYNLGTALVNNGDPDAAVENLNKAVALRPDYAEAYTNLAKALNDSGQVDAGIAVYERIIRLRPNDAMAQSNRIYTLYFHPDCDSAALFRESRAWDEIHGRMPDDAPRDFANDPNPDRRLRIGYVSPDFKHHAESFFTLPLLSAHDHSGFEIFCYSDVRKPDAITEQIRRCADVWRETHGKTDSQIARMIREDRIDILVDLTMHMADNRLKVFAQKPAPIQVTYLAYPGTTGLAAMDYRFTDGWMDAIGAQEFYAERSIRLPDCWVCYDPLLTVPPARPRTDGPIRFGSLNHSRKLNRPTLELWARVLAATAESRFLLLVEAQSHRKLILQWLFEKGIDAKRVEFVGRQSRPDYFKMYDRIDIALDPLPYNGITTTCDALWCGTPVVSVTGATAAGRAGLGILATVGLRDLVANSPDQFVQIARDLAADSDRLATLRATLRDRMAASPMMDRKRFAGNVEAAYRQMWRNWRPQA